MYTVIENALILTGKPGGVIENGSVVVDRGRIAEVSDSPAPSTGEVNRIDATGCTITPGLFNMHDHIARKRLRISDKTTTYRAQADILMRQPLPFLALHSAANVLAQLRSGVTHMRDFGLPGSTGIQTARAVNQGVIPGPTILAGGDPICITGGHSSNWGAMEADGPVGVMTAVRKQIIAGASVLKFMGSGGLGTYPEEDPGIPELTPEELTAGISEAHKFGKRTATHAYSTQAVLNAVRAGTGTIEHGAFLDEEAVAAMVERGTGLVPTLSSVIAIAFQHRLVGNDDMYKRILEDIVGRHMESVRMAWNAGVPVAAGTDTSGEVVEELKLITEATGAPIIDVLRCATATAAELAGVESHTGTLEPGKAADIVVAEGDLLKEGWQVLRRPRTVFKDGISYSGEAMPLGVRLGQLNGLYD